MAGERFRPSNKDRAERRTVCCSAYETAVAELSRLRRFRERFPGDRGLKIGRPAARQQFVQYRSQSIDIRESRDRSAAHLLGTGVIRCHRRETGCREGGRAASTVRPPK